MKIGRADRKSTREGEISPCDRKSRLLLRRSLPAADRLIVLQLDQLYRKLEMPVAERLSRYEKAKEIFMQRDDLMIEYVTL